MRRRTGGGFGLLELLIAIGILAVAFVAVAGMVEQGGRSAHWTRLQTRAMLEAACLLDREAARPFEELERDCALGPSSLTTDELAVELTRQAATGTLIELAAKVSFELPGPGRRPRHTVTLRRVVARPDASYVVASREGGIS